MRTEFTSVIKYDGTGLCKVMKERFSRDRRRVILLSSPKCQRGDARGADVMYYYLFWVNQGKVPFCV